MFSKNARKPNWNKARERREGQGENKDRKFAWAAILALSLFQVTRANELRVGAGAANVTADDSMVIGGGIGPGKATGQEGELRGCRRD